MRYLLVDDLTVFTRSGKSVAGDMNKKKGTGPIVLKADDLQRAYDENEVAADQAYRGKVLIARGTVESVNTGHAKKHYITLDGGSNMFIRPNALMASGYVGYLASLVKGQEVALVCKGGGKHLGSAWLRACIPAADWINSTVTSTIPKVPGLVTAGDEHMRMMAAMAIVLAAGVTPEHICWANDACVHEFAQARKRPEMPAILSKRLGYTAQEAAKLLDVE